jgi:hypothetical protein
MSYKLKILLDLSVDTNVGKEEVLTSKMLSYNPPKRKLALQDLPIFSPFVPYSNLANRILNMFYYERIELFFNANKFKKVIMNSWDGKKEKNVEERLKIEQQNFDIFIKAILPTAYPISNNYNKSLEYFDRGSYSFFTKGTTKGLRTSYFPFLPSRFGKEFSHIKVNGEVYTVTGVTLKNDVLNHPVYSKLIQEYENIENIGGDGDENPIAKVDNEFNEFYAKYFITDEDITKLNLPRDKESIFTSINDVKQPKEDPRLYNEKYEKVKEVSNAMNKIKNLLNGRYMIHDDRTNKVDIDSLFENLNTLFEYREYIKQVTTVSNDQKIQKVISSFGKLYVKKKALTYIKEKDFDLTNEGSREKEILSWIEKYSPAFRNFSNISSEMLKERYIQNNVWRNIIQKKDNSQYSLIKTCKKHVDSCSEIYESGLLEVKLDRIKDTKKNNYTVIEAHLMINVIEGEMNGKNYKKLKCYYLDKSLGSMFDSIFYTKNNWDISNKKIFFSIKDEVKSINEKIKSKEQKKSTQKKKRQLKKQNNTKKKK